MGYRNDYSNNMSFEDSSNYAAEGEGVPERLQRLRKEARENEKWLGKLWDVGAKVKKEAAEEPKSKSRFIIGKKSYRGKNEK